MPRRLIVIVLAALVAIAAASSPALARKAKSGLSTPSRGIIGGSAASPAQWPFMVALYGKDGANPTARPSSKTQFCTGSVISPQWILTAAHCAIDEVTGQPWVSPQQVGVLAGSMSLASGGETLDVAEIIPYPSAPFFGEVPDVALFRLATPTTAPAVRLADAAMNTGLSTSGSPAWAAGWGNTAEGKRNSAPDRALEVMLPILQPRNAACKSTGDFIPAFETCAGGSQGYDTCQGDSGGPLVVRVGTDIIQAGITSRGTGCGRAGSAGVYTSTGAPGVATWITQTMGSAPGTAALQPSAMEARVDSAKIGAKALTVRTTVKRSGSRSFDHAYILDSRSEVLWVLNRANLLPAGTVDSDLPLSQLPADARKAGISFCVSSAVPGFAYTKPSCKRATAQS